VCVCVCVRARACVCVCVECSAKIKDMAKEKKDRETDQLVDDGIALWTKIIDAGLAGDAGPRPHTL
jgi:hypothetical protein